MKDEKSRQEDIKNESLISKQNLLKGFQEKQRKKKQFFLKEAE